MPLYPRRETPFHRDIRGYRHAPHINPRGFLVSGIMGEEVNATISTHLDSVHPKAIPFIHPCLQSFAKMDVDTALPRKQDSAPSIEHHEAGPLEKQEVQIHDHPHHPGVDPIDDIQLPRGYYYSPLFLGSYIVSEREQGREREIPISVLLKNCSDSWDHLHRHKRWDSWPPSEFTPW